jgi:rhamnogalacturonan acetylesterase
VLTKKHEVVHTYGWYLRKFIDDARARGATPIVCSMPPHKGWDDKGRIVREPNYINWTREVAQQEKIGFINLNEIVAARYDALGHDKVMTLFPADEHDHTNLEGAQLVAGYVVAGLKLLKPDPLAAYFSDQAANIVAADPASLAAPAR